MDQVLGAMMKQLDKETIADETGQAPPDMPDISKLINQVTQSLFSNPQIQGLMTKPPTANHIQDNASSNKPKLLHHKISVTLAELYVGTTRDLKMRKQVYSEEKDKNEWVRVSVPVAISRGMRWGETILLEGVGDSLKDMEPGDLLVTLVESKQHGSTVYEISGDDLHMNIEIGLSDIFSYTAEIEHLDGQIYTLHHQDSQKALTGDFKVNDLGMPKADGTFGDLIVHVDVVVPATEAEYMNEIRKPVHANDISEAPDDGTIWHMLEKAS